MREIKFRGKRLDNGEWVYGDYHRRAGGVHCIIAMEPDEQGKVAYIVHQVNPSTVGQFTGLLDKNGKDIYEGDILQEIDSDKTVIVVYEAPQFCYADNSFWYKFLNLPENFTVIGNIHDNPELLNND